VWQCRSETSCTRVEVKCVRLTVRGVCSFVCACVVCARGLSKRFHSNVRGVHHINTDSDVCAWRRS